MRTTIDLPDDLFRKLKERAVAENLSLKLLFEKTTYYYLREPIRRIDVTAVSLPVVGDGTGTVLVDPTTWWNDVNERA
jgi:hypothetical protein